MIKAVIFDVDGVLLDSFEANFEFYSRLMKEFGYSIPTRDFFSTILHMHMYDAIKVLTGLTDDDGKKIEAIYARGKEPFNDDRITPHMPHGAAAVVQELQKSYRLGIVTSRIKPHIFEGDLRGIEKYFVAVIGYEDTEQHKPHPEPLLHAASKLSVAPHECVYIGDMPTDRQAAQSAGMNFILYGSTDTIGARSFSEIPALIESYDKR